MPRPTKARGPDQAILDDKTQLAPWEEQYARWVAMQVRRIPMDEELQVAGQLRGIPLTQGELRKSKRKPLWWKTYTDARADVMEVQLQRAKAAAIDLIPTGVSVYGQAVSALGDALKKAKDEKADPLPAIRAAGPLLTPLFDRALPKKHEAAEIAPRIVIQLSAGASQRLEAPQVQVTALPAPKAEAADADYEIVSDDRSAA